MKRAFAGALLNVLLGLAAAHGAEEAPLQFLQEGRIAPVEASQGVPKLQFDSTVYDFGRVSLPGPQKGKFTFKNAGDGVLKIEKPKTSCGCTVAGVTPDTLEPGQTGELVFELNITGRGLLQKNIYVTSNDPQSPQITLTVKAEHVPVYEYSPTVFNLAVHEGTSTNVTIQVRRTDGQKLALAKVEHSAPWLSAKIEPADPPSDQAGRVVLTVKADGPQRRLGDWVRVFVEESAQPVFSVWCNVRVVGDVMWAPETVNWYINNLELARQQKSPAMLTRRLSVTSGLPDQPLEVRNVQSDLAGVELEVVPSQPGRAYTIVAKLNDIPDRTTAGKLTFETNLPNQKKVEIPMIVSVVRR